MTVKLFIYVIGFGLAFTACNSGTTNNETTDTTATTTPMDTAASSAAVDPDPSDSIPAGGYDSASSNMEVAASIRNALANGIIAKNDLSTMTADDRKFKYQAFDLNNDGKPEYFVTAPSSYFCGTGGCSAWLLDNSYKLINDFSVLDFPIYVAASTSGGWQDLIMQSGSKFHYVKMKNGKYPSNPSVEPLYKGDPPNMAPQILDIYNGPYPAFTF